MRLHDSISNIQLVHEQQYKYNTVYNMYGIIFQLITRRGIFRNTGIQNKIHIILALRLAWRGRESISPVATS